MRPEGGGMFLVTGSSGHLGTALVRTLRRAGRGARGLDLRPSGTTDLVAAITDRAAVRAAMAGVTAVLQAATLHKPHVGSHAMAEFLATNVQGTLVLLEEAAAAGVAAFVGTSTTSAFGDALRPAPGAPAAWIDEGVRSVPRNIYGVTKEAAEGLCELFARRHGLPAVVLRLARFFPEPDDDPERRAMLSDENLKAVEFLYRRVEIADAVSAVLAAAERAPVLGWDRLIVSATTPFRREDVAALGRDAPSVLAARAPGVAAALARLGWGMLPALDRVYDNARARERLGWEPGTGIAAALARAEAGEPVLGPLAVEIGCLGYGEAGGRRYPFV